jgi:hypothetical protein
MGNPSYTYYVYAGTILRVNKKTHQLQRRRRDNGNWQEIHDLIMWKRIQLEGECISAEKADRLFQLFQTPRKNA